MDGLITAPGASLEASFWESVRALFDTAWPGMSSAMDRAASLGARWEAMTTPFAWFEDGRAVSHVGVLEHPLWLDGERVGVAGLHAVCTHPSRRGRGLALRLLQEAVRWTDARFCVAKLHTDIPALYERVGFRVAPLHTFEGEGRGGGGPARILDPHDPADLARLRTALRSRAPCSRRLCTMDAGWLPIIDACLARVEGRLFHASPGASWIGAWTVKDHVLEVHDVFGPALPGREEVLASVAEPFGGVRWHFAPDLLDPGALPVEVPASRGVLQVRGAWAPPAPVGIPATWEH